MALITEYKSTLIYMFWLSSIAIFKEYQYLKTYTVFSYNLSIVNGKVRNANMLLKHQSIVLY
jgi:hypothetical protein